MKIVITGGKGFIGSNLVDYMVDKNYNVVVIDSNKEGYENKNATYYYNDITKPISNSVAIFDGADAIFHLAAETYIQKSLEFSDLFRNVNEEGTKNILSYAADNNIKNIIFSSTSNVYGNQNNGKPSLETDPSDCLNPYSLSKYNAEKICKVYSDQFNMNVSVLRYFNVYGNRQQERGQYAPVLGKFLEQKYHNQPLTVVGDGLQKRDFVNVIDVVLANYLSYIKNKGFNLYNVGQGDNVSILDLAKLISNDIVFIPQKNGESRYTLADISKIKKSLGWKPSIKIQKYIEEMLEK